jgi:hypothetical protein
VSTQQLHVIGEGHEERFSEDFDLVLASAFESTPDPPSAATELDGVTLLTVLASFAGVGPYDPTDPVRERQQAILQIDPASPVLRSFPWAWWRGGTPMGQFVFTGRTLDPAHTVVADLWFDPD